MVNLLSNDIYVLTSILNTHAKESNVDIFKQKTFNFQ